MTTTELRAYVKNVYTACTAMQTAGDIPAGEAAPLARIIVSALLTRESADVAKV